VTDHKPDALVPSSRPGALAKRPSGDLVARGLADLEALRQAMPDAEECFQRGERLYGAGTHAEAVIWYRRAAEQGHVAAQVNLGFMYADGEGVPQDDVEAVRWYRLAADQGFAAAQFNLGVKYATGRGVPQDDVQAHMWFNLAASRLMTDELRERAVQRRDNVADRMNPTQIAEAQRLTREWDAAHPREP